MAVVVAVEMFCGRMTDMELLATSIRALATLHRL